MDNQAPSCPSHGGQYGILVPRHQCTQIDDVGGKTLGGVFTAGHHRAPGDDSDVFTAFRERGLSERQRIVVARIGTTGPSEVQHSAVLEKYHGIVASKRCP